MNDVSSLRYAIIKLKSEKVLGVKRIYTYFIVHLFQCDLCDANYVGYTARHLHQRISEHRYSAIGKHLETQHGNNRTKTDHLFKVLRKCNSKFYCLVYEMLYINRGGSRGRVQGVRTPPPEMTCGFLIQLVFCKKKKHMWCIGVEVE